MPSSKKLRISGPTKLDLGRIGEYTRREWGPAQKRKYLGQTKGGLKAVRDTPGIGTRRDDIRNGLRAQSVQKHVIFYHETETELVIVRVLHESMNPELHLKHRDRTGGGSR